MDTYTKSYHRAINHLVCHGAHGGDRSAGRRHIAQALRAIHSLDPQAARRERLNMLFISGQFPRKVKP
jgi:hypothetical protein